MLVFTMKVTQENGDEFDVKFASKWFMLNFLLTGPLPVGTCASNFKDVEVEDRLWTAASSVFEYINEKEGFEHLFGQNVGWLRTLALINPRATVPRSQPSSPAS